MSARLRAYVRQHHVGLVAVFFALSGGVAWASHPGGQNTINSADIIDGEVKEADVGQGAVGSPEVKNDSIAGADIAPNSLGTGKIADGSLTGTDVANNSIKGADVDESTLDIGDAARAYASVDPADCDDLTDVCDIDESKGVSSVVHEATGEYCVTAPGLNAEATPAAVTVDFAPTINPEGNASAMTRETLSCGPSLDGFRVFTERQPTTSPTTVGPAVADDNVAFTIVIP